MRGAKERRRHSVRLRPLKSSVFPTLCGFTLALGKCLGFLTFRKCLSTSTLCMPSYRALLSHRQKLELRVSGGKHRASSQGLVPGVLPRLKCLRLKCRMVQEGLLSKLGENSNQESWGPSWYVPGINVNNACEIPKETAAAG